MAERERVTPNTARQQSQDVKLSEAKQLLREHFANRHL